MARLEFARFQFDHHIAAQAQMVKEQVEIKVTVSYLQVNLPSHKGKSLSKLQQKLLDMVDQFLFQLGFAARIGCTKKVKNIRIFENLGGHVRIGWWQGGMKIVDGLALAFMEPILDLKNQHVLAHAKFQSLMGIPKPCMRIAEFIQ